jgi:hypothetical protein
MPDGKYLIGESLREKLKSTIAKVESIPFGGPVSRIPTALEGDAPSSSPKVFRVCTAAGAWPVDSAKDVKFYGIESTPNTVSVLNKLVSLPAPNSTATSRIVNIAKDGTQWYLVSFQMSSRTAIMATSTQTITFAGNSTPQTISFVSAPDTQALSFTERTLTYVSSVADVEVIDTVSATLDPNNCSISVVTTKKTIQAAGPIETMTVREANAAPTMAMTLQTVTIFSAEDTQTATIMTGTYTATFISLEI